MEQVSLEVYGLLHGLGVTPNYAGYFQTAYAIGLCMEEPERLTLVTKLVYMEVAKKYRTTWKAVERNIRTVASAVWERRPEALQALMGRSLNSSPHASQFLAALTVNALSARR